MRKILYFRSETFRYTPLAPMDNLQQHTIYVKLPRKEATPPEVVAEVKNQLFDGFVKRLVELLDFYDMDAVKDYLNKLNTLLAKDKDWSPYAAEAILALEEIEREKIQERQNQEQARMEAIIKAASHTVYYGDHIEKKFVQNEVGHVDSGGSGIIVNK